ncbi:hypothetical protein EIP91_006268 [Steccherinum ochraceum]|uniref:GST N-terminal domain-containing protein n=1 Tax=Steccherinum ochraceum TaxID=92696 RepID=A0A4R0RKP1_9APHY|nr:hypothetical protein EIP91_006268 [Steccherinum ochraceum]
MKEFIFYDMPGRTEATKAWSPNTWNSRFPLNMKGLKYRTEWVEQPDIKALYGQLGITTSDVTWDGVTPFYTVPIIHDPNTNKIVADAAIIADYLDKTYPDVGPQFFPENTRVLHAAYNTAFMEACHVPLFQICVLPTWNNLPLRSYELFKRTREVWLGKLEDIAPEGTEKGEAKWKDLEEGITKIAKWFEVPGGDKPFIGGDVPVFADVQLAGRLHWARIVLGKDSKEWARIKAMNGGRWEKYLHGWQQWAQVV